MHITILEKIASTKKFYPKCKHLAKRPHMADELHQEFLLRLCEIGEDKLKESEEYLDWFCLDVINKIWGKRKRVKCYENGNTSPFFEFTNSFESEDLVFVTEDYNFEYDFKAKQVKNILNKDINSDDKEINYRARVFTYSVGLNINNGEIEEKEIFKNTRQFSKSSKINYPAAWKAFNEYRKRLQEKLKL